MKNTDTLTQKLAKQIADLAEKEALKKELVVSIAIVDEACRLLHFTKMDRSSNASGDIAIAKAKHSAFYGRDTKFHEDLLAKGNNLVLALPGSLPIEGGVRLLFNGEMIGAIGISGAASQDDGEIARAAADFLLSLKL